MNRPFPPGDRTYYVSDERLKAFKQLTPEQRLKWVEELATFLRLAKIGNTKPDEIEKRS
jgi:hypothetical protein